MMIIVAILAYLLIGLAVGQCVYLPRVIRKTITGKNRDAVDLPGLAEELKTSRQGREYVRLHRWYDDDADYHRLRERWYEHTGDCDRCQRGGRLDEEIEHKLDQMREHAEQIERVNARFEEIAKIEAGFTDPYVNFDYAAIRRQHAVPAALMALTWLPYLFGVGWLELTLRGRKTPGERRQASVRHELHMYAVKQAIEAYERELAEQRATEFDELEQKLKDLGS